MRGLYKRLLRFLTRRAIELSAPTAPVPPEPTASQVEMIKYTQRETQRLIEEIGIRTDVETFQRRLKHDSK